MHFKDNPFPKAGSKIQNNFLIFIDHLTCTKRCARCYGEYKSGFGTVPMLKRFKIYKQTRFHGNAGTKRYHPVVKEG